MRPARRGRLPAGCQRAHVLAACGGRLAATRPTGTQVDGAVRRLWPVMARLWPPYDEYQTRTDRDIPVVILSRLPA
jgi:hypothetical protein